MDGNDYYALVGLIVTFLSAIAGLLLWIRDKNTQIKNHLATIDLLREGLQVQKDNQRNIDRLLTHSGVTPRRTIGGSLALVYSIKGRFFRNIRTPEPIVKIISILHTVWSRIRNPGMRPQGQGSQAGTTDGIIGLRLQEGMHISARTNVQQKYGFESVRIGILSIWVTLFISAYVYMLTRSDSHSLQATGIYFTFSFIFATAFIALFRFESLNQLLFGFIDWIACRKQLTPEGLYSSLSLLLPFAGFLVAILIHLKRGNPRLVRTYYALGVVNWIYIAMLVKGFPAIDELIRRIHFLYS